MYRSSRDGLKVVRSLIALAIAAGVLAGCGSAPSVAEKTEAAAAAGSSLQIPNRPDNSLSITGQAAQNQHIIAPAHAH